MKKPGSRFGLAAYEVPGMPWTRVNGKVQLLKLEVVPAFGKEPHWKILYNGEETWVPKSNVVVLPDKGDGETVHTFGD